MTRWLEVQGECYLHVNVHAETDPPFCDPTKIPDSFRDPQVLLPQTLAECQKNDACSFRPALSLSRLARLGTTTLLVGMRYALLPCPDMPHLSVT